MKQCAVCGKGSIIRGARKKLRGNYNPTPKKRKQANLQWMQSPAGGRVLACVKCLRGGSAKNKTK